MAIDNAVYVYVDKDNHVVRVFSSLEKAQAFAQKQWGHEPEWDEGKDVWHDMATDYYVSIYRREVE